MALRAFDTAIVDNGDTLIGPWRTPQQMLAAQVYDGHVSIHDNAMAQKVGFRAATIEGPTHFSQFDPLCERLWGDAWFETGCISAHYRNAVFAGEDVQAVVFMPKQAQSQIDIRMVKRDGTEVLQGSASVGRDHSATAFDRRLRDETQAADRPHHPARRQGRHEDAAADRAHGFRSEHGRALSVLAARQAQQSSPSRPRFTSRTAPRTTSGDAPSSRSRCSSVLFQYRSKDDRLPVKGPAVGLFADQEIRLLDGPLFVGESYELEREVVALSGSRRTESLWVRTRVFAPPSGRPVATMLLNLASIKELLPGYAEAYAALYG